jgi:hypothetical protein
MLERPHAGNAAVEQRVERMGFFMVTTDLDAIDAADGRLSLREAVAEAGQDAGADAGRVLRVEGRDAEVRLEGLGIAGGAVTDGNGGAVLVGPGGSLTLAGCSLTGDAAGASEGQRAQGEAIFAGDDLLDGGSGRDLLDGGGGATDLAAIDARPGTPGTGDTFVDTARFTGAGQVRWRSLAGSFVR